jgi:hypothetical protein
MRKAQLLVLVLFVAAAVIGCNPPTQSQAAAQQQGSTMTPDGKKSDGPTTLKAQN